MRTRKRAFRAVVLLLLLVLTIGYLGWSASGRSVPTTKPDTHLRWTHEYGTGTANVVAIQPYMLARDYASRDAFHRKLECYFREADRLGWLGRDTVVILPEYLGAWLVVMSEKRGVYESASVDQALTLLVASNIPWVARYAVSAPCPDRLKYAVFRMKADEMARTYDGMMSDLARRYRITIVGGSIILPSPQVKNGRLRAGRGALYNVSALYRPDGTADARLATKTFLTADEKPWLCPGRVEDVPIYELPGLRLGAIICADSWFPQTYEVLSRKKPDFLAVLSYIQGDHSLRGKWKGYSGQRTPADVPGSDAGTITLGEAWDRHAFAGRIHECGASSGMLVCLRGRLWDLGTDGSTIIMRDGRPERCTVVDGAAIVSFRFQGRQEEE